MNSRAGVEAATQAANQVFAELERIGGAVGAAVTGEPHIRMLWLSPFSVSVAWQNIYNNTSRSSVLYVKEWEGRPDIGGRFHGEKEELSERRFTFDQPSPGDAVWKDTRSGQMFGSQQLADNSVKLLLQRVRERIHSEGNQGG
jgi:hypothetical protein